MTQSRAFSRACILIVGASAIDNNFDRDSPPHIPSFLRNFSKACTSSYFFPDQLRLLKMTQPTQSPSSFEQLHAYPFHTDAEFAKGLAIILGHAEVPASAEEISRDDDLVIQAKCFFYSRKENLSPPIDFTAYKAWLTALKPPEASGLDPAGTLSQPSDKAYADETAMASSTEAPPLSEPAYPSSFAHIVELITTGQPIPGIQEIPNTVLTGHDISSEKPRRRKPWEKDDDAAPTLQESSGSAA
ncbi:hypothetical protein N7462_000269 [Penicillium macrosclerotiorum]|uniref:uncharacterized protein n=1 Tax=Penicillium macrosclerotiorum TaxID=303699 RepID=UPI002547DBC5|nr:uncharacterized protein N7462_000269 [Penicillium macrosclerotiorum]KAJ5698264.1 hypothetical protein N7462_000269 [Penicillium macrosclerotiorum]